MDLDRFISTHKPAWDRLAHLSKKGRNGGRKLEPAELDELVHLYQRVSGHLAHTRVTYGDPALVGRLTALVADANAAIYGTRASFATAVRRFFFESFPGSVWRIRRFILAAAVLTLLPAAVIGTWIANSDAALEASGPEAVRTAYIEEDFEDYYSSEPAAQFATSVTFNNIRVALTAFALGIFGCVGTAAILVFNGANIGVPIGLFHSVDEAGRFWGLLLPHGLLEITSVIVAGGAGLRLGWALIDPGDRTRVEAITGEGRRCMTVLLGLIGTFVIAGLIEGFVTGSPLATPVRVAVGVAVEAAFLAYIFRFGRSAEAEAAALAT